MELDGVDRDTIRFLIIENNPGWLAVEEYAGNVYVSEMPRFGFLSMLFLIYKRMISLVGALNLGNSI
jgi:hypothetical protein